MSTHKIEVWGDFACFTRPYCRAERFSYPVMTPSAARGVLNAIYFKPEFVWRIHQIDMLEYPRFVSLRKNELDGITINARSKTVQPILVEDCRTQRQLIALKSPRYVISFSAHVWDRGEAGMKLSSVESQMVSRARFGQCYWQPFMGMREFSCFFRYVEPDEIVTPVCYSEHVGMMVYDLWDPTVKGNKYAKHVPQFFDATIKNGTLIVPEHGSEEVKRA